MSTWPQRCRGPVMGGIQRRAQVSPESDIGDELDRLAGDGSDSLEITTVGQDDEPFALGDGGNQQVNRAS